MKNGTCFPYKILWTSILAFTLACSQGGLWQSSLDLGLMALARQQYEDAEKFFMVAVAEAEKFGEEDKRLPSTLKIVGDFYLQRDKYREALPYYVQALDLKQRQQPEDDLKLVIERNQLVQLYFVVGEHARAESLGVHAVTAAEVIMGKENPDLGELLLTMANIFHKQGRYGEAEPYYLQSLNIEKNRKDENKNRTAIIINNLGVFYQDWDMSVRAESLYHRSLELSEEVSGKDHAGLMPILNNLAGLYKQTDRPEKAEELYKRSLRIYSRNRMRAYFKKVDILFNLAAVCEDMSKYKEAIKHYRYALRLIDTGTGMHPNLLVLLDKYAALLKKAGRINEAIPLETRAEKLRENLLKSERSKDSLSPSKQLL
ncbi:tetratricopeptide repeat protein [bacterium]|nr:tetratricopeptide repeat protein [bacterium]